MTGVQTCALPISGNVWELINDWYGQNYYIISPYNNPTGPTSGFIMPDGKPYHGMRGGNWYNGYITTSVNDGHSRVSNRNPSYYRGPQDPNHPWYHVGFRTARKCFITTTGIDNHTGSLELMLKNYPNPFQNSTIISFNLPETGPVDLVIYNFLGQVVANPVNERLGEGEHQYRWDASNAPAGMYSYKLLFKNQVVTQKMILIK